MVNNSEQQNVGRYLIFNDASMLIHQGRQATGASVFVDRIRRTIDLIAMFNFGHCSESVNAIERRTILEGLRLRSPSSVFATFTDSKNSLDKLAFLSNFIHSKGHSTANLSEADLLETDMKLFAESVQKNPQLQFVRLSREHTFIKVADEFASRARDEVDRGSFLCPSVRLCAYPTATFFDIRLQNLGFSQAFSDRAEEDFDDLVAELL